MTKGFLLGVLTTMVTIAVAVLVLFLVVTSGAPGATPAPATSVPTQQPALAQGETWLDGVDLTSSRVVTPDGALQGVVAKGAGVTVTPGGIRVATLTVDATLPYATAAAQVGPGVTLGPAPGGLVRLSREVTIAGRTLAVTATARVSAEDGLLVVTPETVDVGGPGWLDDALSASVRRLVTIRQPVNGLPAGTRLSSVAVTPDGFTVHLTGRNVTMSS